MKALLEVTGLKKHFPVGTGFMKKESVKAVDGVDFTVYEGETLSIVGESGCGKSTTGRCLLRLISPTSGEILFQGKDLMKLSPTEMRRQRREMQLIFQDPFASLNPRKTIRQILMDPLIVHNIGNASERRAKVEWMIEKVGLSPDYLNRYPHEFSGGQRQRIGIARALILQPKLIVADEPVSALDVSIQAQILNLLHDLQEEFKLTYIFISHDLSVVKHISDRVAVMYLGKIVEIAHKSKLYKSPQHPYTKALLSSVPVPNPTAKRDRILLEGDLPSPSNPPSGCSFHPRCPYAVETCKSAAPILEEKTQDHLVSCHLVESGDHDAERRHS
jgi:oligopeptide/dipeptide ABC transporter ATP-binding protein